MIINREKNEMVYQMLHLECGIGGCTFGMEQSEQEYKGIKGRFETICGIDVDPICCQNYEKITGARAVCMDLFSREQYIDFHGCEPPADWHEVLPEDLRKACQGKVPDGVFMSPPCKGFSGLLPESVSKTPKYQALNKLVIRSMFLVVEAFRDDLPAFILLENVPRITSRGAELLRQVKSLLKQYGYLFHEGTHDCGELGGLGQTRKRFLLIARNPKKIPSFIYQPPKLNLKSIGNILGPLPMPGDIEKAGKMHRIPNLHFKTWERLALIPAGQDWRALNDLNYSPRSGAFRIVPWEETSPTVTAATRGPGSSNGVSAVADPRMQKVKGYGNNFRVVRNDETCPTVIGKRVGSGGAIYADPKIPSFAANANKVIKWDEPSGTITGGAGVSNGGGIVQDPRVDNECFNNSYKVMEWDKPAGAVTSGASPSSGAKTVADPRLPERDKRYPGLYKVVAWDKASPTVIGQTDIQAGALNVSDPRIQDNPKWRRTSVSKVMDWNKPSGVVMGSANYHGAGSDVVADPRINCSPRNGTYGVQAWDKPSKTVTASGDIHAGSAAVADPRIPEPNEKGIFIIISEDGTWHRPITTFEMAMLQGLPPTFADGSPLELAGNSDAVWREQIGNMVPPPSATAMGNAILKTIMPNFMGEWYWGCSNDEIWVSPEKSNEKPLSIQ